MRGGSCLSREVAAAAIRASGKRWCRGHQGHMPIVNFQKHDGGGKQLCDQCFERKRLILR